MAARNKRRVRPGQARRRLAHLDRTTTTAWTRHVAGESARMRRWRRPGVVETSRSFDTDGKPDGFWAEYGEDGAVTKAER